MNVLNTAWSLFPALITILLALITKEVYSSLFIGSVSGGLLYSNFSFEGTLTHAFNDGIVDWYAARAKAIEAMLKRVDKGNPVGSINPVVDIYNAVSLTYAFPVGGEDIDHFAGDLVLTVAEGGEDFLALGDEEPQPALPGEVIYRDDLGAVCRCWNWRDGQRTMLTEDTKNAFLIIECVDPSRDGDLNAALERLAEKTAEYLGAETKISIVDADNKEIEI